MQNPAENLVCALTRMKALEPETCRKGESENWEFAGYGGWLNIGYPENGLFETLAGSFLPNEDHDLVLGRSRPRPHTR